MKHYLCGVEGIKRFLNVHLHCVVSNLKMISKKPTLPPPGKIYADAHAHKQVVFQALNQRSSK